MPLASRPEATNDDRDAGRAAALRPRLRRDGGHRSPRARATRPARRRANLGERTANAVVGAAPDAVVVGAAANAAVAGAQPKIVDDPVVVARARDGGEVPDTRDPVEEEHHREQQLDHLRPFRFVSFRSFGRGTNSGGGAPGLTITARFGRCTSGGRSDLDGRAAVRTKAGLTLMCVPRGVTAIVVDRSPGLVESSERCGLTRCDFTVPKLLRRFTRVRILSRRNAASAALTRESARLSFLFFSFLFVVP